MKHTNYKNALKGVSTLDIMKNSFKFLIFLVILTTFSTNIFGRGGHSTLDLVDPSFNPRVESLQYGSKVVHRVQSLANGKILAIGDFNSYNRVTVGKVVRLNADGSLDSSFYTQALASIDVSDPNTKLLLQPDGKIVVMNRSIVVTGQSPKRLVRLNADGTYDTSFNFIPGASPTDIVIDSLGRIAVSGGFPQDMSRIIRLNNDGSKDNSFNFTLAGNTLLRGMAAQGNRLIVFTENGSNRILYRLNDDGSPDTTFTPVSLAAFITNLTVQADSKIIYIDDKVRRLNADGSVDNDFQPITPSPINNFRLLKIADDGKIVVSTGISGAIFHRYLSNGASDASFTPYTTTESYSQSFTIQPDGGIVIADKSNPNMVIPLNNFVRLKPDNGAPDPAFNPGGVGFQTILPGPIRAIETQPDGKILLGGKFDLINNDSSYRIARLNVDSTLDESFQINTTATGNYFSSITDIYQIRVQSDGKIVVSGRFDYVINGVTKMNFVRLNADGSIDNTFVLSEFIPDYVEVNNAGRNRFLTLDGGKVMIGRSRIGNHVTNGPLKFNDNGTLDTSFNSMVNAQSPLMYIDDLAIQPDGKIIVVGTHNAGNGDKSFIARLNADGSVDLAFTYSEEPGRIKSLIALLPGGKMIIAKHADGSSVATVRRLNSDGSVDASFNTLSLPTAIINALLVLPDGKIFIGGNFTTTSGSQVYKNLLRLSADGSFEPTIYNVNEEVLCLAADSEGRVLVGGGFTVIGAGGGAGANRSFVARLTDSGNPFDYDGDGRADISVFRPSENKWYILRSSDFSVVQTVFATAGDVPAPADFDGDGKTDIAIFRPNSGDWWYLSSINGAPVSVHWGAAGDVPRPSDFDGDGKTDFVVYRPSNNVWYRLGSTGATSIFAFGALGDVPLIGDFDGDGKSDAAIFRPSTGDWWYAGSMTGQFGVVHWGQTGDIPVPGDYDADGKTDFVVYRPSNGAWYILYTTGSYTIATFGTSEDKPVPADYDGDGKTDVAVWRPSTGTWYLLQTTAGFGALQWGVANDIPTENAFLP